MKKTKWYQPALMLRAGKAKQVFDCGMAVFSVIEGQVEFVTWVKKFATTRDHAGLPKEAAKKTANIPSERLLMIAGIPEDGIYESLRSLAIAHREHTTVASIMRQPMPILAVPFDLRAAL